MRFHRNVLVYAAAAAVLGAPQLAAADDVQVQLEQMQQRMNQLEDRLQATTDQLQATEKKAADQQAFIERSGLKDDGTAGSSKISAFLDSLTIGGWVSSSYWYNFNSPSSGNLKNANTGAGSSPFNPDANSFSFDQLWFELERPISPENRAGFRADIAFGKIASIINQVNAGNTCPSGGSENPTRNNCRNDTAVYINQAYAQYLIPWGDVTLKGGKFGTLIGAEVAQAPYNWQMSRGIIYNLFQPIDHVGVIASKTYDNGIDWALGYVNGFGFGTNDPDNNESKSVLGRLGLTGDIGSIAMAILWGPESAGNDHTYRSTFDFLGKLKPWEGTEFWANFDYGLVNGGSVNGASPSAWGIAVAGRQAITDRLGLSLRSEYAQDNDGFFCSQTGFFCSTSTNVPSANVFSLTGTLDYALTQQLTVKTEVRWDKVFDHNDFGGTGSYITNNGSGSFGRSDQILGGVEMTYKF